MFYKLRSLPISPLIYALLPKKQRKQIINGYWKRSILYILPIVKTWKVQLTLEEHQNLAVIGFSPLPHYRVRRGSIASVHNEFEGNEKDIGNLSSLIPQKCDDGV